MGKISKKAKKNILNVLFLVLLIGVTLVILITSNRELNFQNIKAFILSSNPLLLVCAFLCMLLFIGFEGLAIHFIARKLGYKKKLGSAMAYSSADIYYSAITPSASGGQPASAYYMIKDGIDAGSTTFTLILNLIAYTAAILIIGAAAFIISAFVHPGLFSEFDVFVKVLVIAGFLVQSCFLGFFIACMVWHKGVLKIGNGCITLLAKIKLVKKPDKWREKLVDAVEKYRLGFEEIKKRKIVFLQALMLNLAQRISQILITCFVCLAAESTVGFWEVFVMQSFVTMGYNSVPLPGGVGAFEYMYLHVYGLRFENAFILSAMMVSRTISYYLCILVSGGITLAYHVRLLKKSKIKEEDNELSKEKTENGKEE